MARNQAARPDRTAFGRWWLRLLGPAIAVIVLSRVDTRELLAAFGRVQWPPFLLSLAAVVPLLAIKAWRWRLLIEAAGTRISFDKAIELYTLSAGAGSLTPGAVGDFWKGFSPDVGGRSIGLWASAVDRLWDVGSLIVLGVIALATWIDEPVLRSCLLGAIPAAIGLGWWLRGQLGLFARQRLPRWAPLLSSSARTAIPAAAATLLAVSVAYVRFLLLVRALNMPLGSEREFYAFVLSSGVAALPLSIAGVGTRDVALIGVLTTSGVSAAEAVALSSLCLALYLWNGVVAAILWLARVPGVPG